MSQKESFWLPQSPVTVEKWFSTALLGDRTDWVVVHNFSLCISSMGSRARIHTFPLVTGPGKLPLRTQDTFRSDTLADSPALCRLPEVAPPWHCFCSQVTWVRSGNIEEREKPRVYLPASFINTDSCTRYHGDQKWSLPTSSSFLLAHPPVTSATLDQGGGRQWIASGGQPRVTCWDPQRLLPSILVSQWCIALESTGCLDTLLTILVACLTCYFFTDKLPKQTVTTFVITAPTRNVLVKGYLSGKLILQMKKFNSVILFLSTHTKICNTSDTCHAHCA